jgi:hypothetical protein
VSMHSMTYLFVFLLLAIVVVGILYAVVRTVGGRIVESDHTADPHAPRPDGFGAADRRRADSTEGHEDPEVAG